MGDLGKNILMGMTGYMTQAGMFVEHSSMNEDGSLVLYVSIPENSYKYNEKGLVDISTPEKFIKNFKEKITELNTGNGNDLVKIRIKYKVREGENWTKENGQYAFEYNKYRIISNAGFPVNPYNK